MVNYSDKAVEYFKSGYNCSQSVFLAFSELYNLPKETALKLASSFGGGMGRLREVCGAVTAMFAIAGLSKGYTEPNNDKKKAEHYETIQKLAEEFRKNHGSIICRELLNIDSKTCSPIPEKRTTQYYKKRPCENFVRTAAQIIERELLPSVCDK